jgi:tellurium resistance protein TerD
MPLGKGQTKPLNVTKTAKHRIVVGLGWDPAIMPNLMGKVQALAQGKAIHHDLDLACHIFNPKGEPIDVISADPAHAVDASGHIYHSGDNKEGIGEGDDEEISVELKDLPRTIHSMIFTAKISSGQSFNEINNPEIRLADAYTDHNLLGSPINSDESIGQDLFIFCQIQRSDDESWQLRNISRYEQLQDIKDMNAYLAGLLTAP